MSRVAKCQGEALKSVSSETGEWLERTSNTLRKHGVATPEARYDRDNQTLTMPWIGGRQGHEVLGEETNLESFVVKAAKTVAGLHRVPISSLELAAFDPWKKIQPRLRNHACIPKVIQSPAEKAAAILRKTFPGDSSRIAAVHGDFHIGQLVFGDDGRTWLLDLEDLAFGEAESDLANFAAHLATSSGNQDSDLLCAFRHWSDLLASEWREADEVEADRGRLEWYGSAALLRRALKLSERRRPAQDMTTAARAIAAAQSLAQSTETIGFF